VELRRPLRTHVFQAPDADAMRGLGRSLAGQLTAGDLVVLSGELGAGKTTFTQGLGAGLGVRGDVTSPTFVIARVHPSLVGGPDLVHVDAYRLGGLDELDDLDLDASLDDVVTVVEWGEGLAEGLSESRLEVVIVRGDAPHDGLDPRRVEITPVGPRWHAFSWRGLD
jgi:tRNA threonylcarbamoyladenosine biosynthesis protein TsaE